MSYMGVNPANQLRITGMATGLDTDEYVKKMTLAQQNKIDKANQDKEYISWKQEAYIDIIKDLKTLTNDYLTMSGSKSIVKSSAYVGSKVTSDNESVIKATALAGAVNGDYKVHITNLAKNAVIKSKELKTTGGTTANRTTTLADVGLSDDSFNIKLSIKINGNMVNSEDIAIGKTDNIEDVMDNINNTKIVVTNIYGKSEDKLLKDYIKPSFSELTGKLTIESRETGAEQQISIGGTGVDKFKNLFGNKDNGIESNKLVTTVDNKIATEETTIDKLSTSSPVTWDTKGEFTVTIKGQPLIISKTDITGKVNTIGGITKKIDALDNVTASYNETTGKLVINTDDGTELNIVDDGKKNFENLFGKTTSIITNQGQDATVAITPPGESTPTTINRSANSFNIDGITYELKETSEVGEDTTLSVKADASESVEKISGFIKEYNKIVAKVNEKLKEKKDYSYTPLTAAQKKDMKEDQIKAWEEKAKKGILKNDNNLQNMLSNMRKTFFDGIKDVGLKMSDLGINTSRDTKSKNGQIVFVDSLGYENDQIGKEKLKKALETNGDQVMEFFNKRADSIYSSTMSSEDRKVRYESQGIFQRIEDVLSDYTGVDGSLIKKAGYENSRWIINNDLSKKVEKQNKQIKELTKKLYSKQDYYYKMFSRLETAMNQMNSQQNWLAAQMGQ